MKCLYGTGKNAEKNVLIRLEPEFSMNFKRS